MDEKAHPAPSEEVLPEPETIGLLNGNVAPLIHAARLLSEAETAEALTEALDYNLRVWVAIKALLLAPDSGLPPDLTRNLAQLAQIVAALTFKAGDNELTQQDLSQLTQIDMEIAGGLLDGYRHMIDDAGQA